MVILVASPKKFINISFILFQFNDNNKSIQVFYIGHITVETQNVFYLSFHTKTNSYWSNLILVSIFVYLFQ